MNDDLGHLVALADGINHIQAFDHLTKTGVIAVEMRGIAAAVADEKLGASGVSAGMRHGKNAAVVKLIAACEFAVDFITRATRTGSGWVTSLNYEIRNYAVEYNAVIKPFPGQRYKVFYCVRSVCIEEFDLHYPFFGVDFSGRHVGKFSAKMGIEIEGRKVALH